jgi:hypothetical protein
MPTDHPTRLRAIADRISRYGGAETAEERDMLYGVAAEMDGVPRVTPPAASEREWCRVCGARRGTPHGSYCSEPRAEMERLQARVAELEREVAATSSMARSCASRARANHSRAETILRVRDAFESRLSALSAARPTAEEVEAAGRSVGACEATRAAFAVPTSAKSDREFLARAVQRIAAAHEEAEQPPEPPTFRCVEVGSPGIGAVMREPAPEARAETGELEHGELLPGLKEANRAANERLAHLTSKGYMANVTPAPSPTGGGAAEEGEALADAIMKLSADAIMTRDLDGFDLVGLASRARSLASRLRAAEQERDAAKRAVSGLLSSADSAWEERGDGHDWREACQEARGVLGWAGRIWPTREAAKAGDADSKRRFLAEIKRVGGKAEPLSALSARVAALEARGGDAEQRASTEEARVREIRKELRAAEARTGKAERDATDMRQLACENKVRLDAAEKCGWELRAVATDLEGSFRRSAENLLVAEGSPSQSALSDTFRSVADRLRSALFPPSPRAADDAEGAGA